MDNQKTGDLINADSHSCSYTIPLRTGPGKYTAAISGTTAWTAP